MSRERAGWNEVVPDDPDAVQTLLDMTESPRIAAAIALRHETKWSMSMLRLMNIGDVTVGKSDRKGSLTAPMPPGWLDDKTGIVLTKRKKGGRTYEYWVVWIHNGRELLPDAPRYIRSPEGFKTREEAVAWKREWREATFPIRVDIEFSVPYVRRLLQVHPLRDQPEAPLFVRLGTRGKNVTDYGQPVKNMEALRVPPATLKNAAFRTVRRLL